MRRLRSHLTYANVMSTLAVFLVVGGGAAYAADTIFSTDIVDGEVKAVDIGKSAVLTSEIGTNAIRSADVRDDSLAAGGLGSSDIAPNTLQGGDILNGSLTGDDVQNGSLDHTDIGSLSFLQFAPQTVAPVACTASSVGIVYYDNVQDDLMLCTAVNGYVKLGP